MLGRPVALAILQIHEKYGYCHLTGFYDLVVVEKKRYMSGMIYKFNTTTLITKSGELES